MPSTTPSLKHLSFDANPDEIIDILHSDGGVIIDTLISSKQIEDIKSELKPYLDSTVHGFGFSGEKTKRVGALIARSTACGELALNPLINEACEQYLSPYCDGYQLHFSQAVSISKDEAPQTLHRDRFVWGGYVPNTIETQFSTIWAISDFTKENGATHVVPGSHKWEKKRRAKPEEVAYAEMKAGSVLLYSGSTIHGGGANITNNDRIGVLLHYTLNWLRQEENQYLSCPPDFAKKLPQALRALIGYTLGGPVLGFFTPPEKSQGRYELTPPEKIFED